MKIYLQIEDNIIRDAKFKTFGCGAAIATSAMLTQMVKGKTIEEAMKITNKAVADALDGLPQSKCTVLVWPRKRSKPPSGIMPRRTGSPLRV